MSSTSDLKTFTISLTAEQYQMLKAQVHYENWWLGTHTDGVPHRVSTESLAASYVRAWIFQKRQELKERFNKQFDALEQEMKDLDEEIEAMRKDGLGDPGAYQDLLDARTENENAYHVLTQEWNAFLGPKDGQ